MSKKSKKRKLDGEEQSMVDWEHESFLTDELRVEMESMWEIPQIFHFLHLTKDALNFPHLSMYEMERMLMMPRGSRQLANIMTSLLSSPITKAKLRKIPPMPYEFWTNILAHKMNGWFKVYHGKHQDAVKVLETIGVEPEFWNVFPDLSNVNGKDFEDLTFKQRVWLLKTVCDTVMHTRKTVQEELSKQPWEDQFDTVLGIDRYGARYIYFPQFIPTDLRIYRHCIDNTILSTVKAKSTPVADLKVKPEADSKTIKSRKRKSRWRNGITAKSRKRITKQAQKDTKECKCSGDSGMDSLTNEESVNSAGTYSNNNHIRLNGMLRKRTRSLSKASDESAISSGSRLSHPRSSGYNSTSSIDSRSVKNGSARNTFKGFPNVDNEVCNIAVISGILNGLKEEIDNDGEMTNDGDTVLTNSMPGCSRAQKRNTTITSDNLRRLHLNCVDSNQEKDDCNEKTQIADNLSSSSKTDDEKLNEIIGVDRVNEEAGTVNFCDTDEVQQISSVSRSDDEKLNASKSTDILVNNERVSLDSLQGNIKTEQGKTGTERNRSRRLKGKTKHKMGDDVKVESDLDDSDNNCSLDELRKRLQEEAVKSGNDSCSDDSSSEIMYNLRRPKEVKTKKWKEEVESFQGMLVDLSISNFQLVADSVEGLRDLIAGFSTYGEEINESDATEKPVSMCEAKLIKNMTDLLTSVEAIEPTLKEAMRKARSKLQREWTNFQEGAVHCQVPVTQRYRRYRNLPYPQLAPTVKTSETTAKVRRNAVNKQVLRKRSPRGNSTKAKSQPEQNRKEVSVKRKSSAGKVIKQRPQNPKKKTVNNNREGCFEPVVCPHTQNNYTQMRRSMRTSWKNGPTLRQSMRLPAHQSVHPLQTLLRKSGTVTVGQRRRTQTRIGFYQALVKGKINVRLPIED